MDDQTIKSYFLGELPAAEAEQFEEQTANDGEIAEQSRLVETELIDDYLRRALDASERRAFENVYLTTDARHKKLESAENLWRLANLRQKPEILPASVSWRQILFGSPQKLAFAGLIIAAAVGIGLFLLLKKDRAEIARVTGDLPVAEDNRGTLQNAESSVKETNRETPESPVNSNAFAVRNNASNKKSAPPKIEVKPTPEISVQPPTLASFTLLPGILRGEGEQSVKLPPHINKINLRLSVPKDAAHYQNYRAVLQTADGETTATVENLKSFNLALPAAKLENRTYMIRLEGKTPPDTAESIADYTFRVRR